MFKTMLTLGLCLLSTTTFAQQNAERSCFEWSFGMNRLQYFSILAPPSEFYSSSESVSDVRFESKPGFTGGIVKNFDLSANMTLLRFGFLLSHHKNKITYSFDEGEPEKYSINSVSFNSPLHWVQYYNTNAVYRKKTSWYSVAGATYSRIVKIDPDPLNTNLKLLEDNVSIDLGAGIRFYAKRKHLGAVELRYGYGLLNRRANETHVYNRSIRKIRTNTLTLLFSFS